MLHRHLYIFYSCDLFFFFLCFMTRTMAVNIFIIYYFASAACCIVLSYIVFLCSLHCVHMILYLNHLKYENVCLLAIQVHSQMFISFIFSVKTSPKPSSSTSNMFYGSCTCESFTAFFLQCKKKYVGAIKIIIVKLHETFYALCKSFLSLWSFKKNVCESCV